MTDTNPIVQPDPARNDFIRRVVTASGGALDVFTLITAMGAEATTMGYLDPTKTPLLQSDVDGKLQALDVSQIPVVFEGIAEFNTILDANDSALRIALTKLAAYRKLAKSPF